MLSPFETYYLSKVAESYIKQVRDALKNKPIERISSRRGAFSAPANASGRLMNSVQKEITDEAILVTSFKYIGTLITGRRPNMMPPPVAPIAAWMKLKGVSGSPFAVAKSIGKHGNSVWRKHKGADSGLLSDVNIEKELQQAMDKIAEQHLNQITTELLKNFAA